MTNNQKLELTWIGKGHEEKIEPRILLEDPEKGYGDKNTGNMLIHGDNLLALKALEADFAGQIKCIYIDPPYNTGSAFEHYDDNLEHSTWLSLMKPRLEILWSLLHNSEGSFWISIDDYEMPYLRVLLDEVCGRSHFIACNVWQKRYSRENREAIGDVHEYVIVYAKNPQKFKEIRNLTPPDEKQKKVYRNPNNDPKGPWRPVPMTAQEGHATKEQFYEIETPSGKVYTPPKGRCWGISKATYKRLLDEGRIYFGKNGDSQPNTIRYLSEIEGFVPWTWWTSEEVGHTDEAKKEIYSLFGKVKAFDTPKPERLLQRIIHIATNPGDLILDSFLGSGTTVAVAQKMKRKYIGIEFADHCYTLCQPRLKAVVDGEQGGISKAVNWQGGGGFRFYELAPSLLKKDNHGNWVISEKYNAEMLAAAMAKQEGFHYSPDSEFFWKQGFSTEKSYIFTTTAHITAEYIESINNEMKSDESLLICATTFDPSANHHSNILIKKIPQILFDRCEFGKDNYNLNIIDVPEVED
jgi:adenine-specific DNA-methyltransferase